MTLSRFDIKTNNLKKSVGLTFSEFHIKVEIEDTNFQKTAGPNIV